MTSKCYSYRQPVVFITQEFESDINCSDAAYVLVQEFQSCNKNCGKAAYVLVIEVLHKIWRKA
ncbi:MAG: hypothetical protein HQK61_00955 [Desulfamplus sp.]|nr:hypothetical protein [Desulfamplus sp.]